MTTSKGSDNYQRTVRDLKRIRKEADAITKKAAALKMEFETKVAESEQDRKIKSLRAKMKKG
jgi:hypothetical protein